MPALKRVLITGSAGAGAVYLAEHILAEARGVEIHGLARKPGTPAGVTEHRCDLLDEKAVLAVLERTKPEAIFHLAAKADVRASFDAPAAVFDNNVRGTSTLLEAIRKLKLDPVFLLCGSGEVYGDADGRIDESAALAPLSPYAASKAAQDLLALSYFRSYGLRVVITRTFSYINPRRADLFASAFARQIAEIERGERQELVHGNLDSVRTFIDVRDAAAAYWLAAQRCRAGEVYNVGGGQQASIGDVLEKLKRLAKVPVPCRQDPKLLRPADIRRQTPDASKFIKETGWQTKFTLDQSLENLLAHWRKAAVHA